MLDVVEQYLKRFCQAGGYLRNVSRPLSRGGVEIEEVKGMCQFESRGEVVCSLVCVVKVSSSQACIACYDA